MVLLMKPEGLFQCQAVRVCVWSHASRINPLIAGAASGPEAEPLSSRGSRQHPCDNVCSCKSPSSWAAASQVTSEAHPAAVMTATVHFLRLL